MPSRGKKYEKIAERVPSKVLSLKEAVESTKKLSYSKFDGTVELHVALNLPKDKDPKSIKGSVSLPHMEAKAAVIAVAVPDHLQAAVKEAGADIYVLEDLLKELKDGKVNFDILLSVPEVMSQLASMGKVLGPKGLMPNPKNGTVADGSKIVDTIGEFKRGKLVFKADAAGGIHIPVGKVSFEGKKLQENIKEAVHYIAVMMGRNKEAVIKNAYLTPTMGPAVQFDIKLMD
ncbi:MAG: 50S ribosomal protein L1 [Candidatus Dojkabacteria bacterium]|nr:MAG: 50S ribosomal protein L1 [Candidatus Dojkabacteria bacterium]